MRHLMFAFAVLMGFGQGAISNNDASIDGVVRKAGTSEPVAGAQVTVTGASQATVQADAEGHFIVRSLPAGRYNIRAQANGYFEVSPDAPLQTTTSINVPQGQHVAGLILALSPGGALAGRLLNPDGQPSVQRRVSALKINYRNGRRVLSLVRANQSNDRGEFRIFGLAAGQYYLRADFSRPPGALPSPEDSYVATYYPGTGDVTGASEVTLQEGAEIGGLDFGIAVANPVTVSGTVVYPISLPRTGPPPPPPSFYLVRRFVADTLVDSDSQRLTNSGRSSDAFQLRGVAAGSYWLHAIGNLGSRTFRGVVPIEVGHEDISGITVMLNAGVEVLGRVTFSGSGSHTANPGMFISLQPVEDLPADGAQLSKRVSPNSEVLWSDVHVGQYYVQASRFEGYISDISQNGRSVYGNGIVDIKVDRNDITLIVSTDGASIAGVVTDKSGKAVPGATVLIIPDVRRRGNLGLYQRLTADGDGQFNLSQQIGPGQQLAPGEYKVFALKSVPPGSPYANQEFIAAYESAAIVIHADKGSVLNLQVPLIPASHP